MIKQTKLLHHIQKGIKLEIIKPSIQITISKSDLNSIIAEALADADASTAIKRILNPFISGSFPQFPEFTNVTLGDTDESGATTVILRMPRQTATTEPKVDSPIASIEPLAFNQPATAEYVEPEAE